MKKILFIVAFLAVFGALSLAAVLGTSSIDIYTDRSEYQVGDTLSFDGRVTRFFQGVDSEVIGLQISSSIGTVVVDQIVSDETGAFSGIVQLPDSLPQGSYTISVSSGGSIVERDFEVVDTAHRMELFLNQLSFSEGDEVIVSGLLTFDSVVQEGAVVALQVESPLHGLLFVDQVETNQNGRFSSDFSLPSNVQNGDYLVFVSSGDVSAFELIKVL